MEKTLEKPTNTTTKRQLKKQWTVCTHQPHTNKKPKGQTRNENTLNTEFHFKPKTRSPQLIKTQKNTSSQRSTKKQRNREKKKKGEKTHQTQKLPNGDCRKKAILA